MEKSWEKLIHALEEQRHWKKRMQEEWQKLRQLEEAFSQKQDFIPEDDAKILKKILESDRTDVVICGPNNSGKSKFMSAFMGIEDISFSREGRATGRNLELRKPDNYGKEYVGLFEINYADSSICGVAVKGTTQPWSGKVPAEFQALPAELATKAGDIEDKASAQTGDNTNDSTTTGTALTEEAEVALSKLQQKRQEFSRYRVRACFHHPLLDAGLVLHDTPALAESQVLNDQLCRIGQVLAPTVIFIFSNAAFGHVERYALRVALDTFPGRRFFFVANKMDRKKKREEPVEVDAQRRYECLCEVLKEYLPHMSLPARFEDCQDFAFCSASARADAIGESLSDLSRYEKESWDDFDRLLDKLQHSIVKDTLIQLRQCDDILLRGLQSFYELRNPADPEEQYHAAIEAKSKFEESMKAHLEMHSPALQKKIEETVTEIQNNLGDIPLGNFEGERFWFSSSMQPAVDHFKEQLDLQIREKFGAIIRDFNGQMTSCMIVELEEMKSQAIMTSNNYLKRQLESIGISCDREDYGSSFAKGVGMVIGGGLLGVAGIVGIGGALVAAETAAIAAGFASFSAAAAAGATLELGAATGIAMLGVGGVILGGVGIAGGACYLTYKTLKFACGEKICKDWKVKYGKQILEEIKIDAKHKEMMSNMRDTIEGICSKMEQVATSIFNQQMAATEEQRIVAKQKTPEGTKIEATVLSLRFQRELELKSMNSNSNDPAALRKEEDHIVLRQGGQGTVVQDVLTCRWVLNSSRTDNDNDDPSRSGLQVAVKVLPANNEAFMECHLLWLAMEHKLSNVAELYGCHYDEAKSQIRIVMKKYPHDLKQVIFSDIVANSAVSFEGSSALATPTLSTLSQDQRCKIVLMIITALRNLHQVGISHRDIKPANILLDENNIPYLTDFGVASDIRSADPRAVVGTFAYMAPEVSNTESLKCTKAADIYSFGLIVCDLLVSRNQGTCYVSPAQLFNQQRPQEVADVLAAVAQRPEAQLPEDWSNELKDVIGSCLNRDPSARPSAQVVLETLHRIWRPCVVCFDNPRQIRLSPCNHLVLCHDCASKMKYCPTCRAEVKSKTLANAEDLTFDSQSQ